MTLRQQAQELAIAAERAGTHTADIREALQTQANELGRMADHIGEQALVVEGAVAGQAEQLAHASEAANQRVREMGDVLRQEARELHKATDLAASRAEGIRDALRSQAEHLTTASEQAETKARDIEALLATRTAELHAAVRDGVRAVGDTFEPAVDEARQIRSEEHTSELQSLMRIPYAV